MFQTRFDRWLIEKFVYDYHILVYQIPKKLPFGVKKVELPTAGGNSFQYRLEISNSKKADKVISYLRDQGLSFKTQVHERKHWYNWLINNKNKSFTFRVFWWINLVILIIFGGGAALRFSKTDQFAEMKKSIMEVLDSSK